ncbi:MAG: rRNA maturation RNase YbeY [Proteobacteria bacterium]|nr:rRNA maturation RNase YbeY [Pseudomonadota bacterium]MBU1451986.1 rRNA maturation RNase YbeY [Pseudomonadota bacterium]MBU2468970.1 rRNA maturation RNase YbeY [Pseudomonadota bacterium]MBU2517701.1 rRNA maturation RNase YbeY [Pseudomonadota bacterium]
MSVLLDQSWTGGELPPGLVERVARVLELTGQPPEAELSLVICGDDEIAQINQQWLGRQGPTNVISFAQSEGGAEGINPELLGDVVVSADTAAREAAEHGLDPDEHLMRLIIHGILHILGYEHEQGGEPARLMEEKTEELLTASA